MLKPKDYQGLYKGFFKRELKKYTKEFINQKDIDGITPLHLASYNGDFATVQYLLKMGADPKAEDNNHKGALDLAVDNNVRKYLLDLKDAAANADKQSVD